MNYIKDLLITAVLVLMLCYLLPGVEIKGGFFEAVLLAMVLGLINAIIRPVI